jgi:uncharacterized protein (DUF1697 family)
MDTLKQLFRTQGCTDVDTFIASGNVTFTPPPRIALPDLVPLLEATLQAALGWEVKTFLRTDAELADIAAFAPWPPKVREANTALNIGFCAEPLTAGARKAVMALETDIDHFHVRGREVWWLCKHRQSDSTFSNVVFERAVKASATWRGANTVLRLAAKNPPALHTERAVNPRPSRRV